MFDSEASLAGVSRLTRQVTTLRLFLRGMRGEAPQVEIREEGADAALTAWTADDLVSDIALRKLAATAREAENWIEYPLPIAGGEWSEEGAPATVLFWMDFGEVVFRARGRGRVTLSLRVRTADGEYSAHGYDCNPEALREFGLALARVLDEYGPWDGKGQADMEHEAHARPDA